MRPVSTTKPADFVIGEISANRFPHGFDDAIRNGIPGLSFRKCISPIPRNSPKQPGPPGDVLRGLCWSNPKEHRAGLAEAPVPRLDSRSRRHFLRKLLPCLVCRLIHAIFLPAKAHRVGSALDLWASSQRNLLAKPLPCSAAEIDRISSSFVVCPIMDTCAPVAWRGLFRVKVQRLPVFHAWRITPDRLLPSLPMIFSMVENSGSIQSSRLSDSPASSSSSS